MTINDGDDEIFLLHIITHCVLHCLSFIVGIENLFFHHSLAHGGHLRTVVGIDDPGHNVATKCRTYLVEQILINLARFLFFVISDLQRSTIGCKSAAQCRRNTGAQVTANDGSTHQADLRLFFFKQLHQDGGVRQGHIGRQTFVMEDVQHIHAVRENLLGYSVEVCAGSNGFHFAVKLVGQ